MQKLEKPPQKVAYLWQLGVFFSATPPVQNSPELHFLFIIFSTQPSLLESLHLAKVALAKQLFSSIHFLKWLIVARFNEITIMIVFLDRRNIIIGSVILAVAFSLGVIIGHYGNDRSGHPISSRQD